MIINPVSHAASASYNNDDDDDEWLTKFDCQTTRTETKFTKTTKTIMVTMLLVGRSRWWWVEAKMLLASCQLKSMPQRRHKSSKYFKNLNLRFYAEANTIQMERNEAPISKNQWQTTKLLSKTLFGCSAIHVAQVNAKVYNLDANHVIDILVVSDDQCLSGS